MTHDELRYAVDGLVAEARAFRKRNTLVYTDMILSLITTRLSDVTPKMVEAGMRGAVGRPEDLRTVATADWRAMLAASPLNGEEG